MKKKQRQTCSFQHECLQNQCENFAAPIKLFLTKNGNAAIELLNQPWKLFNILLYCHWLLGKIAKSNSSKDADRISHLCIWDYLWIASFFNTALRNLVLQEICPSPRKHTASPLSMSAYLSIISHDKIA